MTKGKDRNGEITPVISPWDNMKAWVKTRMVADNAKTSAWQEVLERMEALEREEEIGRNEQAVDKGVRRG